jgi:hypothetical protein
LAGETSLLSRHFSSHEPAEQVSAKPQRSVLTSSDKILRLKRKLNLWKNDVVKGYQLISSFIENHHEELQNKIKHYFPSLSTQVYDNEEHLL